MNEIVQGTTIRVFLAWNVSEANDFGRRYEVGGQLCPSLMLNRDSA